MIDRALQLNENLAFGWLYSGFLRVWLGDPELALDHLERAMRLNLQDPQLFQMQTATAYAHFVAGRYAEAAIWAEKALIEHPTHLPANRVLAASYALLGHPEQASIAVERLRALDPTLRISNVADALPVRKPEVSKAFVEGLRKAGLPD